MVLFWRDAIMLSICFINISHMYGRSLSCKIFSLHTKHNFNALQLWISEIFWGSKKEYTKMNLKSNFSFSYSNCRTMKLNINLFKTVCTWLLKFWVCVIDMQELKVLKLEVWAFSLKLIVEKCEHLTCGVYLLLYSVAFFL